MQVGHSATTSDVMDGLLANDLILAVVWRVTPLFAEWISSPANVLFRQEVLTQGSVVLELGCGISGIVALTLAPRIGSYVATDQGYVLKLLNENLAENTTISTQPSVKPARQSSGHAGRRKSQASQLARTNRAIETMKLDWELDSLSALPDLLSVSSIHMSGMIDAVIACDCIYNEALIDPFVRTCAELCRLSEATLSGKPTVCIVAQQLRSPVVFESWLSAFHKAFRVWRVPEELLTEGLKENTGFALHMGLLREIIT